MRVRSIQNDKVGARGALLGADGCVVFRVIKRKGAERDSSSRVRSIQNDKE